MDFGEWLAYFRANPARHTAMEAEVDWGAAPTVDGRAKQAFVRSFQRFELGEKGDGERLLTKAERAGDPVYFEALSILVEEEQKHSALFGRGLDHLGGVRLESHWSDSVFTALRRSLGLRTELALFLIAETVAMNYFIALAESAPDPVLRGIGQRIATDERNHIRFQSDRLTQGFAHTPAPVRLAVGLAWTVVAAGAAAVVVIDHRVALRACGITPLKYWLAAMSEFRRAATVVLSSAQSMPRGPLPVD